MSRLKLPPNPRHLAPSGPGSLAGAVTTAGAVRVAHCQLMGSCYVILSGTRIGSERTNSESKLVRQNHLGTKVGSAVPVVGSAEPARYQNHSRRTSSLLTLVAGTT